MTEEAYTAALADSAGVAYKTALSADDVTIPDHATLRRCLHAGLMKNAHQKYGFLLAQPRLRPSTFRALMAHICRLAASRSHRAARASVPGSKWLHGGIGCRASAGGLTLLCAGLIAPLATVSAVSLLFAAFFIPVIALRASAALELADAGAATPHSSDGRRPR